MAHGAHRLMTYLVVQGRVPAPADDDTYGSIHEMSSWCKKAGVSDAKRATLCAMLKRPDFDVAALPGSAWEWSKYEERVYKTIDDGWKVAEFHVHGDMYRMHHRDPIKWLQDAFLEVTVHEFSKYHTPREKFKNVDGVQVRVFGDPVNCNAWLDMQRAAGEHKIVPIQVRSQVQVGLYLFPP